METSLYPRIYLYKRIVQAKLHIDRHYGEQLDLDNIADEAHFSKFHFIRLFKTIYGKTPHHYLTQVRIENAKRLLQNDSTITETCALVGFESVTSFTGLFRKLTGSTPSMYRSQQRKRQEEIENPSLVICSQLLRRDVWIERE